MDPLIVKAKLEALRRCVKRIAERRAGSADALRASPDLQDIVSVNLTRAVQLCVDIAVHVLADTEQPPPQTMGDAFDGLSTAGLISPDLCKRLRGAVGFRNIAVHSYQRSIGTSFTRSLTTVLRTFANLLAPLPGTCLVDLAFGQSQVATPTLMA